MSNSNRQSYFHALTNENNNNCNTNNENEGNNTPPNSPMLDLEDISLESNAHPRYLHNNDHLVLVLISKKLTRADNFEPWRRSMQIALSAKNKLSILDGSFPVPEDNSTLKAHYNRVNDMVITCIPNCVSDEISDRMNFVSSAASVWKGLQDRFSSIDDHRIYQILKDIHALAHDNKLVEIYFHKMKNLWDEYSVLEPPVSCKCGAHKILEEREQRRKLQQFLVGLHDSFTTTRG